MAKAEQTLHRCCRYLMGTLCSWDEGTKFKKESEDLPVKSNKYKMLVPIRDRNSDKMKLTWPIPLLTVFRIGEMILVKRFSVQWLHTQEMKDVTKLVWNTIDRDDVMFRCSLSSACLPSLKMAPVGTGSRFRKCFQVFTLQEILGFARLLFKNKSRTVDNLKL